MRNHEAGVVLFNVLVMTALMALVVLSMLSIEGAALSRSQAFSEAGQALALGRAAEASVIEALSEDTTASAEVDHLGEVWAEVSQRRIEIEGGSFELEVTDAQSRYNLRGYIDAFLDEDAPQQQSLVFELLSAAGLSESERSALVVSLRESEPAATLSSIVSDAGLAQHLTSLERYFVILPRVTNVNANTASVEVLEVILGNPAQARLVQSLKRRNGFVSSSDLSQLGLNAMQGLTVTSEFFEVIATVEVGGTLQRVKSLIYRDLDPDGLLEPIVFFRERLEPFSENA